MILRQVLCIYDMVIELGVLVGFLLTVRAVAVSDSFTCFCDPSLHTGLPWTNLV